MPNPLDLIGLRRADPVMAFANIRAVGRLTPRTSAYRACRSRKTEGQHQKLNKKKEKEHEKNEQSTFISVGFRSDLAVCGDGIFGDFLRK
jgi:hypothetical protein